MTSMQFMPYLNTWKMRRKIKLYFFSSQSDLSISDQNIQILDDPLFIDISNLELAIRTVNQLSDLYLFEDKIDVGNFLFQNNILIDILFQAKKHILQYFGSNIILFLELNKDPEEDYNRLFIIIGSNLPVEDQIYLLEELEDDWWFGLDSNVRNLIGIDIRTIL